MNQEIISTYAFRLKPGEDLRESIERTVKEKNIKAGWVATCVGSLLKKKSSPGECSAAGMATPPFPLKLRTVIYVLVVCGTRMRTLLRVMRKC